MGGGLKNPPRYCPNRLYIFARDERKGMTRLTRYVLGQAFGVAMFITLGLTAAIWLIGSLKLIDFVVNRGVGIQIFLSLAVMTLPQWVTLVLPIALVIAVIFTYNKLTADSELIVRRARGH